MIVVRFLCEYIGRCTEQKGRSAGDLETKVVGQDLALAFDDCQESVAASALGIAEEKTLAIKS